MTGSGGVVQTQDEGRELMPAGDAVEGQPRPAPVGPADPDTGGVGIGAGFGQGELVGEGTQGLHVACQLLGDGGVVQVIR